MTGRWHLKKLDSKMQLLEKRAPTKQEDPEMESG